MEADGLSLDDLFSQCVFQRNDRDLLLKTIRLVKSDYQPNLNLQTNQCNLPLVQDFYAQVCYRDSGVTILGAMLGPALLMPS